MKATTTAQSAPNHTLSTGILQAIAWVDAARRSTRLEQEADRLTLRLRRCHNRALQLANAQPEQVAIGLYGHNTAAKAHLLAALAPAQKGCTQTPRWRCVTAPSRRRRAPVSARPRAAR